MGKIKELKSEQDTAMLVVRTLRAKYFKGDALEEVLEGHHWDNLEDSIESNYNMKENNEAIEEHAKKLGIVRDLRIIQYKMGLRDVQVVNTLKEFYNMMVIIGVLNVLLMKESIYNDIKKCYYIYNKE